MNTPDPLDPRNLGPVDSGPLDADTVHPAPLDLDLVRAHVEGRMAPAQRDAFVARLADDPALAELVAAYTVVHGVDGDVVPPMQTRFEDLRLHELDRGDGDGPRLSARPWIWRVAAAAALLAIALGAFLLVGKAPDGPPPPVVLAAIPADADAPDAAPIPAALEASAPAGRDGLRFLDGYAEALAAARLLGRPLLLFAQVPTCPLCRELERDQFHDAALATAVEPFVLGRENMMKPSAALKARLEGVTESGWPFFVVDGADGRPATMFGLDPSAPMPDGEALARLVTSAYVTVPVAGRRQPLPWDAARKAIVDLRAADAAPDERARYEALARVGGVAPDGSELAEAVRVRRVAQAARARAALDGARAAFERGGVEAARAALEPARVRFAGTPFHDDLARVAAHLARFGSFPVLEVRK